MSTNRIFHWGILGCGKIAHEFAEDLALIGNANLHAVASRSEERAKDFASTYYAEKWYGDYQQLVDDDQVDIIYIATPHSFHYEHTLLGLNAKKAVLCEKPFAMNADQVKEMIACAKENKTFLMEALWTRFLPHYQKVLEFLKTKELGEITHLQADFGFDSPFDPDRRIYNKALGGGSLLDVGIYPVFAALTLLGQPKEITASAVFGKTQVDHQCTIEFRYAKGVTADLCSAIDQKTPTECIITCQKGIIKINSRFHEPSTVSILQGGQEETLDVGYTSNGYYYEAVHVQEMLAQDRFESDVWGFDQSLALIELLDTIRERIGLEY
ncbi:Gfo/Idh/MocA family oxidoreductase [Gangjinia marincola]|uniref:Gfo/Idh/MocA family oxidoreductase n=1 Tax=Gangjinia marincola TaxID=578463 RepID=A0ABN1MCU8_9FLAO